MPESTFDDRRENHDEPKGTFPTFRVIPSRLLRIARCLLRGWKKSWRYLLAIIIVIVIAYTTLDIYATAQFNHQLNLIREKREPTSLEEITPPKIPDSENAAILYNRAVEVLTSNRINAGNMGLGFAEIPTELDKKNASTFLTKNAKAIGLIRQATDKPSCRFDVDWQDPFTVAHPELQSKILDLSRLLSLQARYEAETGRNAMALKDVRRLYIMVQQMSGQRYYIGALMQVPIPKRCKARAG